MYFIGFKLRTRSTLPVHKKVESNSNSEVDEEDYERSQILNKYKFNPKLHKNPVIWAREGTKQVDKLETQLKGDVKLSIYDKRQNKYVNQKQEQDKAEVRLSG